MAPTLILYGSKARGDARPNSDVDLLYALEGEKLQPPTHASGVSVHRYPKGWLEDSARAGTLFAYHVAFEGVPLEDPEHFIDRLRKMFRAKASYEDEIKIGALVMKLLLEADWGTNFEARRRFFWALRTVLIALSASKGRPVFATTILEALSGVTGVAALIDNREHATFGACHAVGAMVLAKYLPAAVAELEKRGLREVLIASGGIGRDSVRVLEEGVATADIGLAIYL